MASNKKTLEAVAELIIASLRQQDIVIQRYNAYSTNSIYLKLDLGVSNSIRLSDHPGKSELSYRYNLMIGHKGPVIKSRSKEGYERYSYPLDKVGLMVSQIIDERKAKIDKYGMKSYRSLMEKNYHEKKGQKGFWAQAEFISSKTEKKEPAQ